MKPGLELIEAVNKQIDTVRTKSLDLSFNELLDMYTSNPKELYIDPDYQRLFRWSEAKQSQLIESILLELPLPPIFVIEKEEGHYELIDGLQRISSYLAFRGKLEKMPERNNLELVDCDIVKELNGFTFDNLPEALKIKLKRNFVRVEIIRKESDKRLRYYMFKRLNTGGELLSDQEIRNCVMRLVDDTFNKFLIDLSSNPDFRNCISTISEEMIEKKHDQELVLRFFAFKNYRETYKHEVGDFLTEYMEKVSQVDPDPNVTFDYDAEKAIFEKTFKLLNKVLGPSAFSPTNEGGSLRGGFSYYHFEAFSLGLQGHLDELNKIALENPEKLKSAMIEVKNNSKFRGSTTGGGKNYPKHLSTRIAVVAEKMQSLL